MYNVSDRFHCGEGRIMEDGYSGGKDAEGQEEVEIDGALLAGT